MDAGGCDALNLGTSISVMVTENSSLHYDFSYPDRNSLLADGWDFIAVTPTGGSRNTEQTTGAIVSYNQETHPGLLRIPVDEGDLWSGYNSTRNTLFQDLPLGSDQSSVKNFVIPSFSELSAGRFSSISG